MGLIIKLASFLCAKEQIYIVLFSLIFFILLNRKIGKKVFKKSSISILQCGLKFYFELSVLMRYLIERIFSPIGATGCHFTINIY